MGTALILCGGAGTRLQSLLLDVPKCLVPVAGRPFLEYLLEQLIPCRLDRVVLCTGVGRLQIRESLEASSWPFKLCFSEETTPLGTGGALRQAIRWVHEEWFFALNGDSFTDCGLEQFRQAVWHSGLPAGLVASPAGERGDGGFLQCDEAGMVTGFSEKKSMSNSRMINAGIYFFQRQLWVAWPDATPLSLEFDLLPEMARRRQLYAHVCHSPTWDIGTPERLAAVRRLRLSDRTALADPGSLRSSLS